MEKPPVVRCQSYGKSQVRLSKIDRSASHRRFTELTAWIQLDGDFEKSYSAADNSLVVATDTMKNTVYVLASQGPIESIERFAQTIGRHFLDKYNQVGKVTVRLEAVPWTRLSFAGREHDHAFVGGGSERMTCDLTAARDSLSLTSGIIGLQVLKSTGSGFVGFPRDENTTLPETEDRIFATTVEAHWPCRDPSADWTAARSAIRAALLDVFANQYSKSVQHTLYEMARAALAACSLIDEISITMPNQHHLPVDLTRFGRKNANEVFVPTCEPFGRISATIARGQ